MRNLSTRAWLRIFGSGLILAALLGVVIWGWGDGETTADAYVTGHVHAVSARVSNTVVAVQVDDNQHVHAGDVLVALDPKDYLVNAAQAEAQLSGARSSAASAQAQIAQAEAAIANADAVRTKARADFARAVGLLKSGGISRQNYDADLAAATAAQANCSGARAQLASATASRDNAIASIRVYEENLESARLALAYTRIVAPIDGYVGRKTVEVGQRVNAGQTLLFIVSDDVWVVANYKETQLRDIALHAPVAIALDAMPDKSLRGYVDSFSPASGAQFALLPADNATGNFTKVVQRVPIKIRFNADDLRRYRSQLIPGLSVETHVERIP